MPSTLKQKGVIIESKKKNSNNQRTYILVAQRTGFIDVSINNTRYYYNASAVNQPMTSKNVVQRVVNSKSSGQKTIVISRKR